jgi:hypothetical protein
LTTVISIEPGSTAAVAMPFDEVEYVRPAITTSAPATGSSPLRTWI